MEHSAYFEDHDSSIIQEISHILWCVETLSSSQKPAKFSFSEPDN
jgi:hypothetical protein